MSFQAFLEYFPPEIYRMFFPWMQRVVTEPAFGHGFALDPAAA